MPINGPYRGCNFVLVGYTGPMRRRRMDTSFWRFAARIGFAYSMGHSKCAAQLNYE